MEGIASVSVSGNVGDGIGLISLHHDECRALAKVESGASFVERTALLLVENHQRLESVEMESRKCFSSAGDDDIGLVVAKHLSTHDYGVYRR